jgi:Tfp pilus assembly protein PilF
MSGGSSNKTPVRVQIFYYEKKKPADPAPFRTTEELPTIPGGGTLPAEDPFGSFPPGEPEASALPTVRTSALGPHDTPPARPAARRSRRSHPCPTPPSDFSALFPLSEPEQAEPRHHGEPHHPRRKTPPPADVPTMIEEALEYHRLKLQSLAARPGARASSLADRALFGHGLFARGRVREAQVVFESIVSQEPEEAFAYTMLGALFLAQGDDSKALALFGAALALDPDDPAALVGRADIRLQRGQPQAALPDLERAVQADPLGKRPFSKRARALLAIARTTRRSRR